MNLKKEKKKRKKEKKGHWFESGIPESVSYTRTFTLDNV